MLKRIMLTICGLQMFTCFISCKRPIAETTATATPPKAEVTASAACASIDPTNLAKSFKGGCLDGPCRNPKTGSYPDGCPSGHEFFSDGTAHLWRNCHHLHPGKWTITGNKIVATHPEKLSARGMALDDCLEECGGVENQSECDNKCREDSKDFEAISTFTATSPTKFRVELIRRPLGDYPVPKSLDHAVIDEELNCLKLHDAP